MEVSALSILLTSLLVVCNGSFLSYDIKVAEMSGDKEVRSEESEIFLDESFLPTTPPSIVRDYQEDDAEIDEFLGRETFNLTDIEISFGKNGRHLDEHMNFALGFGAGLENSPTWSKWTCCRHVVNIQSRERVVQVPRVEMEYKRCRDNYCPVHKCKDNINVCDHFISSMGQTLCDPSNMMATFMSHHCPETCKFCHAGTPETTVPIWPYRTDPWRPHTTKPTRRPFITTPTTTRQPWWMDTTTTRRPPVFTKPVTTKQPWWMITTTTRRPYTTRRPSTVAPWWTQAPTTKQPFGIGSKLAKVTILTHNLHHPYPSYKFTIDDPARAQHPWHKIPQRGSTLSHFYLYKQPTDIFTSTIRFCSSKDNFGFEKWSVTKRRCGRGWSEKFRLYGSLYRTTTSTLYYVGSRGRPLWTSRLSKGFPNTGYTSSVFYFYGPKVGENKPKPTRPSTTRRPYTPRPVTTRRPYITRPITTRRPYITRPVTTQRPYTRPTYRPFPTTTRRTMPTRPVATRPPIGAGPQPTDPYNRECLESHNFFRAVHNVPALQWSPELARTSQSWANQLKLIAPERPDKLVRPNLRTRNWPHSESGKGHRNSGDGENIAWDLSGDGSPAKESVLRWYSEIFYYNRRHPTHSPAPNKPVGHLTQMLWKDTTHLGCAMSQTQMSKYRQLSTWSVAHYGPGGNIRYGNSASMTLQLYNEQVPDFGPATCMTKSGACTNGNQCMAFGPSRGSCACANNQASCRSSGGCIVWCTNRRRTWPWKEECQGDFECKCTREKGAVCK